MSRGAPVLAAISLNRCAPRISSRTTSSDHFSPTTSRAPATEQTRGAVSRTSLLTGPSSQKRVGKSNPVGYGREIESWKTQPTRGPRGRRHERTAGRTSQRPAHGCRPRDRRTRRRQARPARPALRPHRFPGRAQGRHPSAGPARRPARARDHRRGQGRGHLRDDAGGEALQPDRQRPRRRCRDAARHGHGLCLAHLAAARLLVHDARHQRALPPRDHPRHRTGHGHRRRAAQRTSYGDRRRPDHRADVRPAAGDGDLHAARRARMTATLPAAVTTEPPREPSHRVVLIVLSLAAFMASLDLFIVNVAFPDISREFHGASLGDVSWILNGYAVLYAALLVPLGRLADRYGRLNGFLAGLALFTAASAACAASQSLWTLVAFRALQAVGAAALTPTSLGLLLAATPDDRKVRAVRTWAAVGALAAAFGPVVGGMLVQASWRWVFLVNIPVGVTGLLLASRFVPDSRDVAVTRVPDLFGSVLVTIGVGAMALALVKGPSWGWSSARDVVAFVASAAALVAFLRGWAGHPLR